MIKVSIYRVEYEGKVVVEVIAASAEHALQVARFVLLDPKSAQAVSVAKILTAHLPDDYPPRERK